MVRWSIQVLHNTPSLDLSSIILFWKITRKIDHVCWIDTELIWNLIFPEVWGLDTDPKINLGLESEFNSIRFGIEINKCSNFWVYVLRHIKKRSSTYYNKKIFEDKKNHKMSLPLIQINGKCEVPFYFVCICQKSYIINV